MGNILKIKLGLILFSLLLLVLIPLLANNFYAPVTYKKWQQLTWDDFQGIAKPFTGWGAGISSKVIVEWDSAAEKYTAYAVQNNQRSWRRKSLNYPDDVLNHEQYHFNITEIHARKMNEYLDSIQSLGVTNYEDKLLELKYELNKMQDAYDTEGDHGVNWGKQRMWEYKIDSMLQYFSNQDGIVMDYYSGAKIYFPPTVTFNTNRKEDKYVNRVFLVNDYSMFLGLSSSRVYNEESFLLNDRILKYYEDYFNSIVSMENINSNFELEKIVMGKDSVGNTLVDRWIYEKENLYKLATIYPRCSVDEEVGFKEIVDSFLSSFEIIDTEGYWFSKLDTSEITHGNYSDVVLNNDAVLCEQDQNDFGYPFGPLIKENVGLLLVVDFGNLSNTIYQNILIIDNEIILFDPGKRDQVYFLPYDKIPNESFLLGYGFIQEKDSAGCYKLFKDEKWINIPPNKN